MVIRIISLILIAFSHVTTASSFYECVGKDGKKQFQDRPCEGKTVKTGEIKTRQKSNSGDSEVDSDQRVSASKLIGSWVDFKEPNMAPYRTTWTFSGVNLTIKKRIGQSFTRRYQLIGNVLHIYHKASDMSDGKPFVEKMGIKSINTKEIVWGDTGPIGVKKLHKLY